MQYVALLARLNLSMAHCKIQNVWSNHSFNERSEEKGPYQSLFKELLLI